MNYELACELKDAGFPQKWNDGCSFFKEDGALVTPVRKTNAPINEMWGGAKLPTLEELIEACGKRFLWVQQTEEGEWEALSRSEPPTKEEKEQAERRGKRPMAHMSIGKGSTPTEAVARLYLSLNKKV